ncbi:MAG: ARPP-1 family domain-containing protein [Planctomycetota bacterium]|jgi:hypothetical protein
MRYGKLLRNLLVVGLVVCFALAGKQAFTPAQESRPAKSTSDHPPTISGPYTHQNLSLYLVHGEDKIKVGNILTLKEALQQKKVRVHETGDVNKLAVENLSEYEIYIQAGEIVRGGKQDRVFEVDIMIEAKSGKVPIGSFCVERGRWRQRGNESLSYFSSSDNMVSSNSLKLAITKNGKQGEVWREVAGTQQRLSQSLGSPVISRDSYTSLELSLENKKLKQTADSYTSKLSSAIKGKDDALGVVLAINGKLYSADTYASSKLFRKLWPKLLEAGATEAIASQYKKKKAEKPPTIADVQKFLAAADKGRSTTKKVSPRIKMITRESKEQFMYETFDTNASETPIHRNCIIK